MQEIGKPEQTLVQENRSISDGFKKRKPAALRDQKFTSEAHAEKNDHSQEEKEAALRNTGKKKSSGLHWPGIEPGPPAWQARILPLNHQCKGRCNEQEKVFFLLLLLVLRLLVT